MAESMPTRRRSDLVGSLDSIRPVRLKADIRPSDVRTPSDRIGLTFGDVVKMAVIRHYGSVKATAYALGEGAELPPLDPSLMMREFDAGKLARLEADLAAKAVVAEALYLAFGRPEDPAARQRRLVDACLAALHELKDAVNW